MDDAGPVLVWLRFLRGLPAQAVPGLPADSRDLVTVLHADGWTVRDLLLWCCAGVADNPAAGPVIGQRLRDLRATPPPPASRPPEAAPPPQGLGAADAARWAQRIRDDLHRRRGLARTQTRPPTDSPLAPVVTALPGWHTDPTTGRLRWHDGAAWTDITTEAPPSPAPQATDPYPGNAAT